MTAICTLETHAEAKRDPVHFRAETDYLGEMGDEVEWLELRNCRACGSTLSIAIEHQVAA
jgi:hypothetical protein